jgi:outer membrane exchange protein TraA
VDGPGLCVTSAVSNSPWTDFSLGSSTYNSGINQFLDTRTGSRVTSVLRTDFDLSNSNMTGQPGQELSKGDFVGAVPSCPPFGCGFFVNNDSTSFASRFRGYLSVKPDMVGRPLHFGFYADDAVSLTIFDRNQTPYSVVTRPPQLGAATWRTTNSVTFTSPGLYPVEVLYTEIVEHAALEMSILDGDFTDFELPANQVGSVSLSASGFQLARPAQFYLTEDGTPPADPDQCTQCLRQNANNPGNGGCGSGNYCNAAAVCAPCTSALYCGPTCVPCGGSLPVCATVGGITQCVECRQDADCRNGQKCNLETSECQECTDSSHCPRGKQCSSDGRCETCSSRDACAGNSCNCCLSTGGAAVQCAAVQAGTSPTCVECISDADCTAPRKCDTVNGRCVLEIAACNTSDRCGPGCTRCPADRPLCMDGQVCVECRSDLDCGDGRFCNSGECTSCTADRRCGARCESCGGDTPYCLSDGTVGSARCVRCRNDGDCPAGDQCDVTTGQCSAGCTQTCGPGTVCDGTRCVECFANSHCACGGVCDVALGQCISGCDSSTDCAAGEYCTASSRTCERGRRKPDTEPRGGGLCCALVTGPAPFLMAALAAVVLAGRRRRVPRR